MNKHIDTIIKSINRHKKGLRDPQIMHPEREWSIGIFMAVFIFISSAAWSLGVYISNRNASANVQTEEQSESVVYRESMVEEALSRLKERTTTLASLLPRTTEVFEEETIEEPAEETASNSDVSASSTEEIVGVDGI